MRGYELERVSSESCSAKGTRKKITEIKMCLRKVALKATAGGAKP